MSKNALLASLTSCLLNGKRSHVNLSPILSSCLVAMVESIPGFVKAVPRLPVRYPRHHFTIMTMKFIHHRTTRLPAHRCQSVVDQHMLVSQGNIWAIQMMSIIERFIATFDDYLELTFFTTLQNIQASYSTVSHAFVSLYWQLFDFDGDLVNDWNILMANYSFSVLSKLYRHIFSEFRLYWITFSVSLVKYIICKLSGMHHCLSLL